MNRLLKYSNEKLNKLLFVLLIFAFFSTCQSGKDNIVIVPESPYPISLDKFRVDTIVEGFAVPYGLAIVNDDEYFVTDRVGKFFHYQNNVLTEISGMPKVATFGDPGIPTIVYGGLMDISLHPNYPNSPWIYLSYLSEDGYAKVDRFQILKNEPTQFETIYTTRTKGLYGNGMRITWEDDSHFFLNIGGATLTTNTNPILIAQDLNEDWGKIHRVKEDGSMPSDNPIFDGMTVPSSIWSYGHRDAQGLFYDKTNDILYGAEHGPKGGDEFNIIKAGGNYGWPLFTYGINYDGAIVSTISEEEARRTTILPEHYWTVPTKDGGMAIGPACLLKVEDSNIADWNNSFLFGSLVFRRMMKYNRDTDETYGLTIEGRVRTIKQLPGGDIIALIERNDVRLTNGIILRISSP